MSELTLSLSLLIAGLVPRLTLRYLQPILMQVLHRLCEATRAPGQDATEASNSGPEFWWRVLNVLAISGSMLLVLTFGYSDGSLVSLGDFLRRTLWLVTMGVFLSVSVVAWQIWSRMPASPAPMPTSAKLAPPVAPPPGGVAVGGVAPGATS